MARKSTAKTRGGKKGKKSGKPKRRVRLGLTRGIGIVSTIRVPPALRQAFRAGLNDPGVVLKVEQVRSYRRNKLKAAFDRLNADNQLGMIITVGGLVAYQAAEALATKPFICLVGLDPTNPGPNCYGGVTLQSFSANPDRIRALGSKGFSPGQIGLFQNPNSVMAGAESAAWGGATPPIHGGVNAAGENDETVYPADFAGIPAGITALVVSGDPFFQDTKDELVAAANNAGKYMCYPVQDYGSASPAPIHGKATLFGPALKDPYALLGERARKVLDTGAKLVPLFAGVPPGLPKDV